MLWPRLSSSLVTESKFCWCCLEWWLVLQYPHSLNPWQVTPKHTAFGNWERQRNDSICTELAYSQGRGLVGTPNAECSLVPHRDFPHTHITSQANGTAGPILYVQERSELSWACWQGSKIKLIVQIFCLERHLFSLLLFLLLPPHTRIWKTQGPWGPKATLSSSTQRHANGEGRDSAECAAFVACPSTYGPNLGSQAELFILEKLFSSLLRYFA